MAGQVDPQSNSPELNGQLLEDTVQDSLESNLNSSAKSFSLFQHRILFLFSSSLLYVHDILPISYLLRSNVASHHSSRIEITHGGDAQKDQNCWQITLIAAFPGYLSNQIDSILSYQHPILNTKSLFINLQLASKYVNQSQALDDNSWLRLID